jgi:hypothetical protein
MLKNNKLLEQTVLKNASWAWPTFQLERSLVLVTFLHFHDRHEASFAKKSMMEFCAV